MNLVFYSIILNNHQANVADELWRILGDDYRFVELVAPCEGNAKGGTDDYASRPYLLKAWLSEEAWQEALRLARTADCCVFSGLSALPFEKERMRLGLLSFDMSERWMKRGWLNALSPTIRRMVMAYWQGGWARKPIYKLCNGAFVCPDQLKLRTFSDKCYKWGYFTQVGDFDVEALLDVSTTNITPLMWCSRYLSWKHPELPVLAAKRLKDRGYRLVIDMYGTGEHEERTRRLAHDVDVEDVVRFKGTLPNDQLMAEMRRHEIFLFTSDRNEGWGAVANESMANGCALVASDAIGSVPYLVKDGENGLMFRSAATNSSFDNVDESALNDLTEKVMWLLDNKPKLNEIRKNAVLTMQKTWSPENAARSLLQLINDLRNGKDSSIMDGPCSKA